MSTNQPQIPPSLDEDIYVKLIRAEQEHTRTRWTVVTFFMSISFALLGFSFQIKLASLESFAMRISALFIYWFALALFWRFATFSEDLGEGQRMIEKFGNIRFNIHEIGEGKRKRGFWKGFWHRLPSNWLLFGFGVLYTIGVVILWKFGL